MVSPSYNRSWTSMLDCPRVKTISGGLRPPSVVKTMHSRWLRWNWQLVTVTLFWRRPWPLYEAKEKLLHLRQTWRAQQFRCFLQAARGWRVQGGDGFSWIIRTWEFRKFQTRLAITCGSFRRLRQRLSREQILRRCLCHKTIMVILHTCYSLRSRRQPCLAT